MPTIRTDIIDVYVARAAPEQATGSASAFELLQLLRASEPMAATWHPIMGHIEPGETAVACAWREMEEEIGLLRDDTRLIGMWALGGVHPFFLAKSDEIVLSPRFAALVTGEFVPRLNEEHSEFRWVRSAEDFMWPGQREAVREAEGVLSAPDSAMARALKLPASFSPR